MKKIKIIILLLATAVMTAKGQRQLFYTKDTIGVGFQFTMEGYHYYKLKKGVWVRFPGANAKPVFQVIPGIFKGKYTPLKKPKEEIKKP